MCLAKIVSILAMLNRYNKSAKQMGEESIPEGEYCVYRHIRLDKNEVFYIGIGEADRPRDRFNRNNHWKRIVSVNNGVFSIDILFENVSKEFAIQKEIELIELYGRRDIGSGTLCNMTSGGEGAFGRVHSEETKRKIGRANKKNKPSIQQREQIRQSLIGKCVGPDSAQGKGYVLAYKKSTGEFVGKYNSILDAGKQLKVSFGNIGMILRGERGRHSTGGYTFKRIPYDSDKQEAA